MTEGVIWKQLLFFAIPLLLGNLFQLLYNTVDSIVVGNFVGGGALAAVGASNPIINLLVSFFMGIATGAGVVISRYFGAGDRENLSRAVHTSMMLVFLAGIFLMAAGAILSPLLLKATGTPEDVLPDAVVYMRIYFFGIIPVLLYNMGAGVLRSVGDSKRPLYYLIVASVVNIGLDLLFVIAFQMGVAGVAWATLIAQSLSAFLVLLNLFRSGEPYRLELKKMRISRGLLGEIVRLGLPAGLQNAIISLSNVVVQANINRFGTTAMAGCAAYGKLDGFANLPVNSFSMAATTFIGQNIGARNRERVKKGARVSVFLSMGVLRRDPGSGAIHGADGGADREFLRAADDLDLPCYAGDQQHRRGFPWVFVDVDFGGGLYAFVCVEVPMGGTGTKKDGRKNGDEVNFLRLI